MAHVDTLSRGAVDGSPDTELVLHVLSVGTDDWLATVQQTDQDIKNIADILGDLNVATPLTFVKITSL